MEGSVRQLMGEVKLMTVEILENKTETISGEMEKNQDNLVSAEFSRILRET